MFWKHLSKLWTASEDLSTAKVVVDAAPSTPGPVPIRTREDAAALIRSSANGDFARRLIDSLEPSVRIHSNGLEPELPIGRSRFGGWPDLPQDMAWPNFQAWHDDPLPLNFLLQLNLAELPPAIPLDLPVTGHLLVFSDMGEEIIFGGGSEFLDRWQVLYLDQPVESLVRCQPPAAALSEHPAAQALDFEIEWTISDDLRYGLDEADHEIFIALIERLYPDSGTWHRLLGHAQPIQGNIAWGAEMTARQQGDNAKLTDAEVAEAENTWRSLLQLDCEDSLLWQWGDVGRFHFMIRRKDLTRRRFDRVMAEVQCC